MFGWVGIRSVMNDEMRRDVTKRIVARVYGAATRYYLNERFVREKWCCRFLEHIVSCLPQVEIDS